MFSGGNFKAIVVTQSLYISEICLFSVFCLLFSCRAGFPLNEIEVRKLSLPKKCPIGIRKRLLTIFIIQCPVLRISDAMYYRMAQVVIRLKIRNALRINDRLPLIGTVRLLKQQSTTANGPSGTIHSNHKLCFFLFFRLVPSEMSAN